MKRPRRLRKSSAGPPATSGLTGLDRDRAASLADEGGTSAATVESQDNVESQGDKGEGEKDKPAPQARRKGQAAAGQGAMLFELSVLPLGGDIHLSDELARVLAVVDRSGLRYQLGPGSTCIEGPWERVIPVIRECHEEARRASAHVVTLLRIEDDQGQQDKIRKNVESVEAKLGKPLER